MDTFFIRLLFGLSFANIHHFWAKETNLVAPNELIDICELDHKTLQCTNEQVIMMEMAQYGRMAANQCTTSTHLGCVSDALGLADRWCSGRPMCFIDEGFQTHLDQIYHTCSRDLTKYLRVVYQCVDVFSPWQCSSSGLPARTLSEAEGYISSHMIRTLDCEDAPWIIRAPTDHIIRIQLLDFSWFSNSHGDCEDTFIEITDISAATTTRICRQPNREHQPIDFHTDMLKIVIFPTHEGEEFLVHYTVLDQADPRTANLYSSSNTIIWSFPALFGCLLHCYHRVTAITEYIVI